MVFAKKSLGQNFLMHPQTAERIVDAAKLPLDAVVLEVGPGTGMLTRALLKNVRKVIAVEADDALAPELAETFHAEVEEGRLDIRHADIRHFDTQEIKEPYHVVANIPYYITGEIIRQFLSAEHKPESMTLLVQKEVAERIARNGGKESLLSLSVTAYGTPEYCFTVPRGAFRPAPSVDSAVLAIRNIRQDTFSSREAEDRFFSILRAGFAHKRKRLAKNLEVVAAAPSIQTAMERTGLGANTRPEDVSIETWKQLAHELPAVRA
ncbi:MAG TPA: 16S rRNA (adenine(1518)-N(6)/adenine(1519)-N(6))-dimethyltransferase RsmA [Candidatus Paceibacterota bacterium]|nr:16S rRNA (adenine(1518)-N(6)/adenine(1519)-N(6))-dimethyltransferase RsmA [Candidatus Paceibacterota bacterium]